ncbi:MAG: DNA polymerase III subunit beta [Bacteroidota bacterium]
MNFVVSSSALLRQLSRVAGAIPSRSSLPIIENFLFEITGNELVISTTNLETSMQTRILVEVHGDPMRVAVPAKILMDILKALPEQPVTISVEEGTFGVEIHSENGKYKISGENGEDFPQIPIPESTESVVMPTGTLLKAVNKTLFAASDDEDKAALNGIFFDLGEHGITFVATDAHRLVRYRRVDMTVAQSANFIVPRKALNLLKGSLNASSDSDVIIGYNDANASFQAEDLILVCRLIDHSYPNYENVIPSDNPNRLFISKKDLASTLRRVNIFANRSTHQVRFKISENTLEISSEDPDFANEASEKLTCVYDGSDLEIGFNAALLVDVVDNLETAEAVIELSEPNRAGIILPNDQEEGENILMLIMPIMLNSYAL